MYKIYIPLANISGERVIIIDKSQVHHLRDVLRLKSGDKIAVFDEKENEYACVIKNLEADKIILEIKNKIPPREKKMKITIACAIPKKSKFDDIVDKLTQLGVDRIIPLETEHVIVKLDKHKEELRLARWRKIAQSASQQSQRSNIPVVEPVKNMKEVLSEVGKFDLKLIPTLPGERKTLKEAVSGAKPKNILVLIGPEGDFSDEETQAAIKAGCIPVSLGESVLRVETAAVAVNSFIRLYYENH